jgi:hypothetical protein
MNYEPDSRLIDWPDDRRFSELVAQHRAGFCAGTQPAPAEACTEVGHVDSIAEMEGDPWIFWAVVLGVVGGMVLSVMFPMGVTS